MSDARAAKTLNISCTQNLSTHLTAAEVSQIVEVFESMGVEHFLALHPFRSLTFLSQVTLEGRQIGGWYDYSTQEAAISLARDLEDYAQPLVWGQISRVSALASSLEAAVQRTLVHELGHHLHRFLGEVDRDQVMQTQRMVSSDAVSNYARVRPREYFAETFAAYVFHRPELVLYDEQGYDMLGRTLRTLRLEVNEL